MERFLRIFCIVVLPVFACAAVCIWWPGRRSKPGRSVADRIAWTVFALGICLMFNMSLYALGSEGDGDFRSVDTVRLHRRLFLAVAMIPVAGPLIVFLYQAARTHRAGLPGKKPPVDDLNW